jgi:NAD(P)-dependent dehydrogenase (short-subunit alcohol dehydrogenase family)
VSMIECSGKTAFVTGAANGIGLGICRALARSRANIVLVDIEQAQLDAARRELATFNVRTSAIQVDVSDAAAFEHAVEQAEGEFGNIHFLFNNAGVSLGAMPLWEVTQAQWEWIFSVNVGGVLNGIRVLAPRMRKHGETGHVINTASIGGLQVNPKLRNGSYAMTKYAIVAASEALALDLQDSAIGVSVLCPALVNTTLHASSRRRPDRLGGPFVHAGADVAKTWQSAGLSPDKVGQRVIDAVARREFFIFTHEAPRAWIEERHTRILAGFDSIQRYNSSKQVS